MKHTFKVGDLISYNHHRYCIITKIEGNMLWGHWRDTKEEAIRAKSGRLTYMSDYIDVTLEKSSEITNWKQRFQK